MFHATIRIIMLADVSFPSVLTTNPLPTRLHLSASFPTFHIISSASCTSQAHTSNVLVSDIDTGNTISQTHPIFSLSHQLLAFTSSPQRLDSPTNLSAAQPQVQSHPPSGTFGASQVDLRHATMMMGVRRYCPQLHLRVCVFGC